MVVLAHKVISKTLYLNIFSKKRLTVDLIDDSKADHFVLFGSPTIQSFGGE